MQKQYHLFLAPESLHTAEILIKWTKFHQVKNTQISPNSVELLQSQLQVQFDIHLIVRNSHTEDLN